MRVLIGFILALSVSLACNQSYEEVAGYKIGSPLSPTVMPKELKTDDVNIKRYSIRSIPEKVIVKLLHGNINGICERLGFSKISLAYLETEYLPIGCNDTILNSSDGKS